MSPFLFDYGTITKDESHLWLHFENKTKQISCNPSCNRTGCTFIPHCLISIPINTLPILSKTHPLWISPGLEISPHHTEWILIGIYTRLAFWMPDFSGVNQIGFNKVTWGIPMAISPSSSLRFLQAISPSHAPSLCVIHASFIWQQIASCSNMNADVAAGVMISFFGFSFSSDSPRSHLEREPAERFSVVERFI